ncbi:MAG TPA: hypothetical protein VG944_02605 [Fimbriimonas sp.]|nr:hypothetical protein [Fimbriimonas sp.]
MIRIVGVQRNETAEREFVLLQNQGSLRINLRGHIVMSECSLDTADLNKHAHVFTDDVLVPAGMYVLLMSGFGAARWAKSKDGSMIYYTYMNREHPVWDRCQFPLHLLNTQHSFSERREQALLLR